MRSKTKLFTVGYEGCYIEEFADFLRKSGVRQIADVRKNPLSRKKGFSKNKLAENLRQHGIEYFHYPGLGVPSAWRKLAKAEKISRKKMFRDYVRKILPAQKEDIAGLLKKMKSGGLAVLCYEADAADCHRFFVAEEMQKHSRRKFPVVHLHALPEKEI